MPGDVGISGRSLVDALIAVGFTLPDNIDRDRPGRDAVPTNSGRRSRSWPLSNV